MTNIAILISLLALCSSCTRYECDLYTQLSQEDINIAFVSMQGDKKTLAKIIFELGECRMKNAVSPLINKLEDRRIVHHIKFKGMTIGYMANVSLKKITGLPIGYSQKDSDDEIANEIAKWKAYGKKR